MNAELPDVSGIWNVEVATVGIAKIPVVGEIRTTTRSGLSVRIIQNGDQLELVGTTEYIRIESSSSVVRTIIPDAFVRSIPEMRRKGHLRRTGRGYQMFFPQHWEVTGANLSDPARESLPTSSSDRRVIDQDGDGHPGVTVKVEGVVSGDIYVIQRGWDEWTIDVPSGENKESLRGSIRWGMEQVILDATSRLLKRPPETRPDHNQSTLRFHRQQSARAYEGLHQRQAS